MKVSEPRFELDDRLREIADDFAAAVADGFSARPKSLPCRFIYDEVGSRLFEEICTLEEYYPTRAEREILERRADELAGHLAGHAVVELGSGNAEKTEVLLAAMCRREPEVIYAPVDICADVMVRAGERLLDAYPELRIRAFAAVYQEGVQRVAETVPGPRAVLWLGSNVGNFTRAEAARMLHGFRDCLADDDLFVLGVDLRKDRATLELAYADPRGVTAAFDRNLLVRANRELGAHFDPESFAHEARYDEVAGVVRSYLVSRRAQSVRVDALDRAFSFAEGERIHVEDATKYSFEELDQLAVAAGFEPVERWTDELGRFALVLWRPA